MINDSLIFDTMKIQITYRFVFSKMPYFHSIGEIAEAAELHDDIEATTVSKWGEVANYVAVSQFLENVDLTERVGLWILNMIRYGRAWTTRGQLAWTLQEIF